MILIPLALNLFITSLFIPAVLPEIHYEMYYGVSYGTMWSPLYYSFPYLYVLFYILLDFFFGGIFAVLSLMFSLFLNNRIAVLLLPYFIILGLHYCRTFLYGRFYIEISPLHFLQAVCVENNTCWWIVLLEGGILFCVTFGAILFAGKRTQLL